ncbi:PglL family O-oligosaccharyltransferase [Paracidovorax avenae]|uniref:PglL family O-oligosaccharyltransferase n=1 Tax=Paracidovorax avenae TaxID=80867 RepID=UPI0009E7D702|nr:O-antigen ligase family protein [Paracidovorax avenae]
MIYHALGASFALGWLFPFYGLPIISFYQEWMSGASILAVLLAVAIAWGMKGRAMVVPHSAWWVVFYSGVGFVQVLLGDHPDPATVAIFLGIGLVFAAAVVVGANVASNEQLIENVSFSKNFAIIIKWIYFSGVISSVFVLLQVGNADQYFFPLVRSPDLVLNRPSANFGQPNLLTLQLVFSLVAAAYLHHVNSFGKNRHHFFWIVFILLAIFLANTRAYLLMCAAVALVSLKLRGEKTRIIRIWAFVLLPSWFLLSAPFHAELMDSLGYIGRGSLSTSFHGDGRLKIWDASLHIIGQYPWLGVGVGAYAVGFYNEAQTTLGTVGPTGNAHNIVLQVFAEIGLVAGSILLLSILLWACRIIKNRSLENWKIYCLAMMSAVAAHSMVEFPLWFVFFLVPCGVFVGMMDCQTSERSAQSFAAAWIASLSVLGLAMALMVLLDYQKLRTDFEDAVTIGNSDAIDRMRISSRRTIFDWHYEYARFLLLDENAVGDDFMWSLGRRVVPRFPFGRGLARYAYFSFLANKPGDAKTALSVMYRMKPDLFEFYKQQNQEYCKIQVQPVMAYCGLASLAQEITVEKNRVEN